MSATMNLFAAVHARWVGAAVTASPHDATHAQLTPALLARVLDAGVDLSDRHVVVAGDRLSTGLLRRAAASGAQVSHYYGAAELSFVAWGSNDADLKPFPGVEVAVRDGTIWARSPYLAMGYSGAAGPLRFSADGYATVGDLGSLTDGLLRVSGRDARTVVTAGATVLLDDVERVLRDATQCDVFVLGVASERLGALVVAVLTDPASLQQAHEAATAQLSRAQRPVRWFHAPHLPTTTAGKVDRVTLADLVGRDQLPHLRPHGRRP